MRKPTLTEIKEHNTLFFSRETMKFFHQTMRDFKVVKSPNDRIFLYAPMKDNKGHNIGYSFKECPVKSYGDITGKLISVHDDNDTLFYHTDLNSILAFIQGH